MCKIDAQISEKKTVEGEVCRILFVDFLFGVDADTVMPCSKYMRVIFHFMNCVACFLTIKSYDTMCLVGTKFFGP